MKQWTCLGAMALTVAWVWIAPLHAQTPVSKPQVCMMPPSAPDGRCLRQLFTQPEHWAETRSLVNVLGYADHQLGLGSVVAVLGGSRVSLPGPPFDGLAP